MKVKQNTKDTLIYSAVPDRAYEVCKTLKAKYELSAEPEVLYHYLRWGCYAPIIKATSNDKLYAIDTQKALWFLNKGDLEYLNQNTHYYKLLKEYCILMNTHKVIPSLLTAKYNKPIVTSDGIRYFSVANYYAAMMTTSSKVREHIAALSPFSCLRYWTKQDQEHHRSNISSHQIRNKVMYKAVEWLLVKDESMSIIDIPPINALFYDLFPMFAIDEESRHWGVSFPSSNVSQGYNTLGSIVSQIKYKYCYESIPF